MTQIDVNVFWGRYPWRDDPVRTASALSRELDQLGTSEAWISHVSGFFWRDPMAGNAELYRTFADDSRCRPIPAVHPGIPGWQSAIAHAVKARAPAIRCDPTFYGLAPDGPEMRELVTEAAAASLPVMAAVRLEDVRQRHPLNTAGDLPASAVRALIRTTDRGQLIITHADREFIEQVHFGSTPDEASRILWDISWIWGPPEDHLELLLETIGIGRFTFGTGMPLRLPETSMAKLDLLNLEPQARQRILSTNLSTFRESGHQQSHR